ncbi:MAG: NADH-quinone oxidoreductase subunit J [Gemmatimonadetes bacterium]|jgi:NADH-quinone oxidoreductase subunit J|nr:NADH-quinone oxidoreductase subunit J [Gemmatimonadota bacterium]MBP9106582.1 NADH-quinone oxidoreductase subunit J [Gemmatimonadaceae bacterium]MBK6455856.1 NADH-quinone oxidoreductase subunit J [Gemmatimonadota bacterium]MBK6842019.1 NADH-quinone oxidoreductase subunit J [Gemmatimonadota bacterium]MBK7835724.1 NADH-quinone oxidoreductase subunit J [Gemmatimonadota bacterium]
MPNFFYELHFYLFGLLAIASALAFVTRKSPVAAALWLVQTMFCLAALYVMMDAHFVGAIQVLVYAGAIMVVFLFVVMLLNLGHPDELSDLRGKWGRIAAGLLGIALLAQVMALGRTRPEASLVQSDFARAESLKDLNAVSAIAKPLFSDNLLAFELTSILLLVAIVGAVVLGKRRASA